MALSAQKSLPYWGGLVGLEGFILLYHRLYILCDEFVALSVDIDNLDALVVLELLSELSNVNVH